MKRFLLVGIALIATGTVAHAQGCPPGDGSPQAYAAAVACQRALLGQGRMMREQQAEQQRAYEERAAAAYRADQADQARRARVAQQQRDAAAAQQRAGAEQARANQLAREQSPDNRCAEREFAGEMITSLNEMMRKRTNSSEVIDIQHLTTERFDPERGVVACHGSFIYNNGVRVNGTYSTRQNVAGSTITSFNRD